MAAKIKDGLFIGDAETSQSEVFINDNKISNLINLAGREVQNIWASHGLVYLTYYWEDRPDYKLFSSHEDNLLSDIVEFIDVSISHGISVLLFSRNGTGRCAIAACLYLMKRYSWGFEKTYDYVYSKKPDIDLNKGFIQQMFALDMKLLASRQKAYAIEKGIDNTFRIEANMTINDISAMLPKKEALRWNSWDPAYTDATDDSSVDSDSKNDDNLAKMDAKSLTMKRKTRNGRSSQRLPNVSEGESDEVILIFSYLNSKNCINALPGPYPNAYDTPKNFKLRFDSVNQEEDVHMFPTVPSNSRYTCPPRGVLKGVSVTTSKASAQPKNKSDDTNRTNVASSKGTSSRTSNQDESAVPEKAPSRPPAATSKVDNYHNNSFSGGYSENGSVGSKPERAGEDTRRSDPSSASVTSASSNGAGSYSSVREKRAQETAEAKSSHSVPTKKMEADFSSSASVSSTTSRSQDLYGFVGITPVSSDSAPGKTSNNDRSSRTSTSNRSSLTNAELYHPTQPQSNNVPPKRTVSMRQQEAKSAKQESSLLEPSGLLDLEGSEFSSAHSPSLTAEERLRNLMADMQNQTLSKDMSSHRTSNSRSEPKPKEPKDQSNVPQAIRPPSLYDLANMHFNAPDIPVSTSYEKPASRSNSNVKSRASAPSNTAGVLSPGSPNSRQPVKRGSSMRQNSFLMEGDSITVMDDLDPLGSFNVLQGSDRSTRPSSAASRSGVGGGGAVRARHDVVTNSQPSARPSARPAWGANNAPPQQSNSRYSSPAARMRQQQSASSNMSVTSVGSNNSSSTVGGSVRVTASRGNSGAVGTGSSSGSRVYRHGSPAPNIRSKTGPAPVSRTGRQALSSSAGGGSSNNSVTSVGSGGPPPPSRVASTTGRSGSPVVNRFSSPARRASSNPGGTDQVLGSTPGVRRRAAGSSPMRASYSGSSSSNRPTSGIGVNSKRFSTPTPQSSTHNEYEGGATTSGTGRSSRNSTPSRSSWR